MLKMDPLKAFAGFRVFFSNKTKTRAYLSERLHFLLCFRYRSVIGVFELFLNMQIQAKRLPIAEKTQLFEFAKETVNISSVCLHKPFYSLS